MFRFASPWLLLLAPVVIAATFRAVRLRRTGEPRIALPDGGSVGYLGGSLWTRIDPALPWIRTLAWVLLVIAAARPQSGTSLESVVSRGVDIVIAVDISESMQAEDFQPLNRLEVAKETIRQFINGRPNDRIGLVAFASVATPRCPLTLDHAMLLDLLEDVTFARREESGTAIGMGLVSAVNRLRESEAKSRIVVLLTDGENNRGQIAPEAAAEIAQALGIRVYTIGVGTEGEAPFPVDNGPFGKSYRYIQADLDEELLREVATETDGRYFRVVDADGLRETFETIDRLEKTEVESRVRVLYDDLFGWFVAPAVGLALFAWLLETTRLRRVP